MLSIPRCCCFAASLAVALLTGCGTVTTLSEATDLSTETVSAPTSTTGCLLPDRQSGVQQAQQEALVHDARRYMLDGTSPSPRLQQLADKWQVEVLAVARALHAAALAVDNRYEKLATDRVKAHLP